MMVKILIRKFLQLLWYGGNMTNAEHQRMRRDSILKATDWTVLPDSPFTGSALASWKTFRQALRDIPEQAGFPNNITWPRRT